VVKDGTKSEINSGHANKMNTREMSHQIQWQNLLKSLCVCFIMVFSESLWTTSLSSSVIPTIKSYNVCHGRIEYFFIRNKEFGFVINYSK